VCRCAQTDLFASRFIWQCFFFDIPFDDDAHFAFSIIAKDESSDAERNAVKELMELVNSGAEKANGASAPRDARYRGESKVSVEVLSPGGDIVLDQKMQYFYPVIIRHVLTKERLDHEQLDDDDIHGEYEICVDNNSRKDVRLLMHLQLQSNDEDARHERLIRGKPRLHKKHLSPLERNVEEAVDRADHIIREMNYMAERERRMKLTSESTNKWVRRFSWMSIIVLLSVTGIQIVYLKSYFQKKKLM